MSDAHGEAELTGEARDNRFRARFGRVFRFCIHYWMLSPALFISVMLARIVSTLIDVMVPLASGVLVDAVAYGSRAEPWPAMRAALWFIAIGAAFALSRLFVAFLVNRMSARSIAAIGRDAFSKVQRFSSDWHTNSFAGSTVRKITRGMTSFDTFTDTLVFNLLPAFIVVIGISAVFSWRWPVLGAIIIPSVIFYIVVVVAISVLYVRPANVAAREWDSRMSGVLADSITANQTVKSFAGEKREDEHFADVARNWEWRAIRSWDRSVVSGIVQSLMLVALQCALLLTGIWLWSQNQASTGDVAALISTQFLLNGYLREIGQSIRTVQRTINDMDDVLAFRDAHLQVADRADAKLIDITRGRIEFERVTFRYSGQSRALYEDFSLVIPAGQRVGLVGPSGAGKSTFVKLIQRLYDVQDGRILIDGQDVSRVTQESL
ncbi:MAG: ABC transporter ATP-binding protein, partial [Alphaproteobacteria bacterium]|nr:ABC transporter ATP-binding protein [Alphaproteobacteria bacterium]